VIIERTKGDNVSDVRHSFAVKKEIDEKFQEIMDYYGTDNKTDVFQRMISEFPELEWKARQYDRIEQDVLAHKTLRRYREGKLLPCEDSRGNISAEDQSQLQESVGDQQ
jgi:hypothetical protein